MTSLQQQYGTIQQDEKIGSTSLNLDVHNNEDTLGCDEGIFGSLTLPFDENVIVNIGNEMVQLKPLNYVVYENDIPYEVTPTDVTSTPTTPTEPQNPPHQEISIKHTEEEGEIDVETMADETAQDETGEEDDNLLTQQNVVICDELHLHEKEAAAATENVQFSDELDLQKKQTHNADVYSSVMQCLSMDQSLQTFLDNSLGTFLDNSSGDITNKLQISDQQLEFAPQELPPEINEETAENRRESVMENTSVGDGGKVLSECDVAVEETSDDYDVVHVELPDDQLDECSSVHNDEVFVKSAPVNNDVVELQDESVVAQSSSMLKNEDNADRVPDNAVTRDDGVPDNPVIHGEEVPDYPITHGEEVPDNPVTDGDEMSDNAMMKEDEDAPIDTDDNDDNGDDLILAEDSSTKGNDDSPQIEKEKRNKSSKAFMEDILGSARRKENPKMKSRARKSVVTTADKSTRPFRCGLCDTSFTTKRTLMKHVLRHSGQNKPYRCDNCSSRFVSKRSLADHMSTHNREKPYHCDTCRKRFSHRSAVVSHRKSHNKNRKYLCGICNKGFTVKSYLMLHLQTHSSDTPYKCSKCDKRFKTQMDLHSHTAKFHSDGRPHQCDQCGKLFTRLGFLNLHKERRAHGRGCRQTPRRGYKPVQCNVCGKPLFSRSALKGHMFIHTDQKPFQCVKCGKKFRCKRTLNVHMLTHSAETLFPCADCSKVFKRRLWLRLHYQRSHSKAKKPHQCCYCDKVFAEITHLGHHLKTHQKPKHTSKPCSSTINSVVNVKTHGKQLRKPFNSTWSSSSKRKSEIQYECAFCKSLFSDKPSLLAHFEAFHGDDVITNGVSSNLGIVNGPSVQLDLTRHPVPSATSEDPPITWTIKSVPPADEPQEFTVITGQPCLSGATAPASRTGATRVPTVPDKTVATTLKETTRPVASTKTTGPLFPPKKPSGTTQTVTPQNRHIRPLLAGPAGPPVTVIRTIGFPSLLGKNGHVVLNKTGHAALVRQVGLVTVNKTGSQSLIGKSGPAALTRTTGPSIPNKTPVGATLARTAGPGSAIRAIGSPGPTGIRTNFQRKVVTPAASGASQQHQYLQVTPGQKINIVVVNGKK